MPYVLRELTEGHKILWDKQTYDDPKYEWLKTEDNLAIPAECLIDLQAKGNEISLWYVADGIEDDINLLAATLRSMRWPIRNFEYVLFDIEALNKAGIYLDPNNEGKIPSKHTHLRKLHRDVNQITIHKLVTLIEAAWETARTGLIYKSTLEDFIIDGINSGEITDTKDAKINPDLRKKLIV